MLSSYTIAHFQPVIALKLLKLLCTQRVIIHNTTQTVMPQCMARVCTTKITRKATIPF